MDDLLRRRLLRTGLSGPATAADPASLVARHLAVQAQDWSGAVWAVVQRLPGATRADVTEALASGGLIRTHVMRPTWHLVAAADIVWLLDLCRPTMLRASQLPRHQLGIDQTVVGRAFRILENTLAGQPPQTRTELADSLSRGGVGLGGDGGHRLTQILYLAEAEALICSGPYRGSHHTYALLAERIPRAVHVSREQSLAALALRYLGSHGPARQRDLRWWSGLPAADVRAALSLAGAGCVSLARDGDTLWDIADGRDQPVRGQLALLPNYDEYVVAYANRGEIFGTGPSVTMDSRSNLLFNHLLVIDGVVAGAWTRVIRSTHVGVSVTTARPLAAARRSHLQRAAQAYADHLGLSLDLTVVGG